MFGTDPVELGMDSKGAAFLAVARRDPRYQQLFRRAYAGNVEPFTIDNVIRAIACFERSIISARSPWDIDWRQIRRFDRFELDGSSRMSEAAQRGEVLFFGEHAACGRCHGGVTFSAMRTATATPLVPLVFHNNGLSGGQPGLFEYSHQPDDFGKFKAPTMRNIELTAPYMHDGSLPTLDAVIVHYASGGRHIPNQSPFVQGFPLSARDRSDLIQFLRTLTDLEVTSDPRFSDPW
jgi:cytochrome c peroxidase